MKVAFASSEIVPFAKTGGLADVAGSLPKELAKLGCDVKTFMPKYYSVDEHKFSLKYMFNIGEMKIRVDGTAHSVHAFEGLLPNSNVPVYFIDCPKYFHRHKIYTNDFDEDERFILFSKAVIELLQRFGWAPDIIHCNDWQTGLIPLFIRDNYNWDRLFHKTAAVYTIHNIAYQGRFGTHTLSKAEIRGDYFYPGGPIEFEGGVNFMKAAIMFSDIISTVSETYAKELLTPEYGSGMDPFLNSRQVDLFGILNGVDYSIWSPEKDTHLPFNYSINDIAGKLQNKKYLLNTIHLPFSEHVPLIGIVSRLASQKGIDLIAGAIDEILQMNVQLIVLGSGEAEYENLFRHVSFNNPFKVWSYIGYNDDLSHLIEAASDMFLMPSKYEPCGLNQIYSLKYGTVPVVRKTGGLADTVQDWNEYNGYGLDIGNGFSFEEYSGFALMHTIKRAVNDFHNKSAWNRIIYNGMIKDYSWSVSAESYLNLYEKAVSRRKSKI
jgi:starch synthase